MRVQIFPKPDGGWDLAIPEPTEAELAAVGITREELEQSRDDLASAGEARRAGKKVVRAMHALTRSVEIEVLEEAPEDA